MSAAALVALPRPLLVHWGTHPEPVPPIEDPRIRELALAAIEAARSAGASYADVRLTHTWRGQGGPWYQEKMSVGVRALVQGYWGFASSSIWMPDEVVRLARQAVGAANIAASGEQRVVELAPVSLVAEGHWDMPVQVDPFTVPAGEVADYLRSQELFVGLQYRDFQGRWDNAPPLAFRRQEKAFASTDGAYATQRLYAAYASYSVFYADPSSGRRFKASVDFLSGAGAGWEYVREAPLREAVPALIEQIREDARLPVKPIDVGRYDVAIDAGTMAAMLGATVGAATELDRAVGYEANAGGTSYLNDPSRMVGTFQMGSPLLTVTADRTQARGLATTRWDDEGVASAPFPVVENGILADFLTTRESASWLKDHYAQNGIPLRSHGCASSPRGLESPLLHVPNLAMTPGEEQLDFAGLIAGLENGLAIRGAAIDVDFQQRTGMGLNARVYEVRRGKKVARWDTGAGFLFRVPELWKNLVRLGGAKSLLSVAGASTKGEPSQSTGYSIDAVPAVVKELTVIDIMRKA